MKQRSHYQTKLTRKNNNELKNFQQILLDNKLCWKLKPNLIFPNELTSFNRSSVWENLLKKGICNLWVYVSYIPAVSHEKQKSY